MKINFVLIRHGETGFNLQKIVQGWQNIPLNETGIKQAQITGDHLKTQPKFDLAWSSDLDRAIDTAKIILSKQNNTIPIEIDKRLRERCFGYYEGKHRDERTKGLMDDTIEGGVEFRGRLVEFFEDLPEKIEQLISSSTTYRDRDNDLPLHILIASHAGPCKELIQMFAKMKEVEVDQSIASLFSKEELQRISFVPNCSCTEIEWESTRKSENLRRRKKSHYYPTNVVYGKIRRAADDSFVPAEMRHHIAGDESVVSPISSPLSSPINSALSSPIEPMMSFEQQMEIHVKN